MAETMDNVPGFAELDPDTLAKIRNDLHVELGDEVTQPAESQPPKRRRRGRPRKYERDEFGNVLKNKIVEPSAQEVDNRPLETLPNPELTTHDAREVAKRFTQLIQGASEIGGSLNSAITMQGKEAENIAIPLASYLARTEATSAMAQKIINEYDVAAFVIATLAYMVRVVKDVQNERAALNEREVTERRSPRGIPERVRTSGRTIEPETTEVVPETSGTNGEGPEGTDNLAGPFNAANLQGPPGNI